MFLSGQGTRELSLKQGPRCLPLQAQCGPRFLIIILIRLSNFVIHCELFIFFVLCILISCHTVFFDGHSDPVLNSAFASQVNFCFYIDYKNFQMFFFDMLNLFFIHLYLGRCWFLLIYYKRRTHYAQKVEFEWSL